MRGLLRGEMRRSCLDLRARGGSETTWPPVIIRGPPSGDSKLYLLSSPLESGVGDKRPGEGVEGEAVDAVQCDTTSSPAAAAKSAKAASRTKGEVSEEAMMATRGERTLGDQKNGDRDTTWPP